MREGVDLADEPSDLVFVGETLIGRSDLIAPGTVSVLLDDETIHIVPAPELRNRCEGFGPRKVRAFMMAPTEFEKLRDVIKRRTQEAAAA